MPKKKKLFVSLSMGGGEGVSQIPEKGTVSLSTEFFFIDGFPNDGWSIRQPSIDCFRSQSALAGLLKYLSLATMELVCCLTVLR